MSHISKVKGFVFLSILLVLASLSACAKREEVMGGLRPFSKEDPAWLVRAKVENAVQAKTRGAVIAMWGEPDGRLSGFDGDIYNLDAGWTVLLLYGGQYGTKDAYVSSVRIGNTDASVGLTAHYSYQNVEIEEDPFSSPGVLLNGQTGQASIGFPAKSSYAGFGNYSMTGNTITIITTDGKFRFTFRWNGEALIFDQENSSDFDWYANIPDGAVFEGGTVLAWEDKE